MDPKELLVASIKDWLVLDVEISRRKADLSVLTKRRKGLSDSLLEVMKTNAIDCFDINGGSLVHKKTKVKKAITTKYLVEALQNCFPNDVGKADEISQYIIDNRSEEIKDVLKRTVAKT